MLSDKRIEEIKNIQHQMSSGEMSIMDCRIFGNKALYDILCEYARLKAEKEKAKTFIMEIAVNYPEHQTGKKAFYFLHPEIHDQPHA